MPHRELTRLRKIQPGSVFLLVLVTVFTAEAAVMYILPWLLPVNTSTVSVALLDSCILTVILSPLFWILVVQPLRQLVESRQRLLSLALSAQETERGRIARDLHDGIGQSLTCLLVGLRTIEESTREELVQTQARQLRHLGGEAHDEIRRLARGLRPAVLDDAGLIPALERLLEDVRSIQDVEATLKLGCADDLRLRPDLETTLYRISQEAITNAIRHGEATQIQLNLNCKGGMLTLVIQDNGRGFEAGAEPPTSLGEDTFGLSSIRERAWLVGGNVDIKSSTQTGSILTVNVPLSPQV